MKKFTAILVALLCAASLAATLTACTNKPTQEEVEQAIADGSVTVEDAVEKGWVTQEWAEEYQESLSVPAIDKVAYHAIGEFMTQTMSGEEFTRDDVADVTFFAFIDPASSEAENYYHEIVNAYPEIQKAGAEVVVCNKGEKDAEMFTETPFPVILYNDSLKEAMGNNVGMVEEMENTASWYVNGSFLSAWYGKVEAEDLKDSAASFVEQSKQQDAAPQDGGMVAMTVGVSQ